ncbi:MAG: hypothetical protein ACRC67_15735 [Inquilinus sp.]
MLARMSSADLVQRRAYSDVIASIADHPINRIDELLPWHWRSRRQSTSIA